MLDLGLLMYAGLLTLALWRCLFFYEWCGVWLSFLNYTALLYTILLASLVYCIKLFYQNLTRGLAYPEVEKLWDIGWLHPFVIVAPGAVVATVVLNWIQTEGHVFEIRKRVAQAMHDRAVQIVALPSVFGVMALASLVPILELAAGRIPQEATKSPWWDFQHPLGVTDSTVGDSAALLEWEAAKQFAFWRYETCFFVADLFEAWALYQFGQLSLDLIADSLKRQDVSQEFLEEGSHLEHLELDLLASHAAVTSLTWLGATIFIVVCIAQTACSLWPYFDGLKDDSKQKSVMFHFQVAGFVASSTAIYNLIVVERAFHRHLQVCSPLLKFLSVKILVSLSFLQRGFIVLFQTLDDMLPAVMKNVVRWVPVVGDIANFSDVQLHLFYPALILFECFLLAVAHCWVWRSTEEWYVERVRDSEAQPLCLEKSPSTADT